MFESVANGTHLGCDGDACCVQFQTGRWRLLCAGSPGAYSLQDICSGRYIGAEMSGAMVTTTDVPGSTLYEWCPHQTAEEGVYALQNRQCGKYFSVAS